MINITHTKTFTTTEEVKDIIIGQPKKSVLFSPFVNFKQKITFLFQNVILSAIILIYSFEMVLSCDGYN